MWRACVSMFAVGGVTCLSGVWTTEAAPASRLAQGVIAGLFLVSGLALGVVRPIRRRVLEFGVLWSILLIGLLMARSDPLGMAPFFFPWPVVFAAYFCSRRVVVVAYGWMVVTLAAALVLNPTVVLKVDTFTGTPRRSA